MDLTECDNSYDMGDAALIKSIPSKNSSIKNGVIAAITLCDGKSTKSLFSYIVSHPEIVLNWSSRGLFITENSYNDTTNKLNFSTELEFDEGDQQEYVFCPANIIDGEREFICLSIQSDSIYSCLSQNKVGTSIRMEYNNKRTNVIKITVTEQGVTLDRDIPCSISKPRSIDIRDELRNSEIVCSRHVKTNAILKTFTKNSKKDRGKTFGTTITISESSVKFQSMVAGTYPELHGDFDDESKEKSFLIDCKSTARIAKVIKSSNNAAVTIRYTNEYIKFTFRICTYSKISIYQYPDHSQMTISTYGQNDYQQRFLEFRAGLENEYNIKISNGMSLELAVYEKETKIREMWNWLQSQIQNSNHHQVTGYQQSIYSNNNTPNISNQNSQNFSKQYGNNLDQNCYLQQGFNQQQTYQTQQQMYQPNNLQQTYQPNNLQQTYQNQQQTYQNQQLQNNNYSDVGNYTLNSRQNSYPQIPDITLIPQIQNINLSK